MRRKAGVRSSTISPSRDRATGSSSPILRKRRSEDRYHICPCCWRRRGGKPRILTRSTSSAFVPKRRGGLLANQGTNADQERDELPTDARPVPPHAARVPRVERALRRTADRANTDEHPHAR